MSPKIVVGVDGSEPAARAVQWATAYAAATGGEVVVAHVVPVPISLVMGPYHAYEGLRPQQLADLRDLAEHEWCKPLADAGVPYRIVIVEGSPAGTIVEIARKEHADLVVTGRRGLGGFAELLMGSTSHQLAHHVPCPLTIVP